ncbi:Alpha-type protein kinase domain-containing protein [Balamuthia mandrillaris]
METFPCISLIQVYSPRKDSYIDGEPHGLTPEVLLVEVMQQNIHYYFGKITNQTDKMVGVFNQILEKGVKGGMPITTLPMANLNDFILHVAESVSSSLVIESCVALRLDCRTLKTYTIDSMEPDWEALPEETVQVFYFQMPPDIRAAVEEDLVLRHKTTKYDKPTELVAKESKYAGKGTNTKNGYLSDLEAQTVASVFANKFNQVCKGRFPEKVHFTKVRLFSFRNRETPRYFTTEPRIRGVYVKYNNNAGYVASKHYKAVLDAFSHWTWCISGKELIIVDLQGVNYMLTDPAIHHRRHPDRYGPTNLGQGGD